LLKNLLLLLDKDLLKLSPLKNNLLILNIIYITITGIDRHLYKEENISFFTSLYKLD